MMADPAGQLRGHVPRRPSWDCRRCRAPWPCPSAVLSLRLAFINDRPALLAVMKRAYREARTERPDIDRVTLADRLLYWVPQSR